MAKRTAPRDGKPAEIYTFDDEDGRLHVVGTAELGTVLEVMAVHAWRYGCTAPAPTTTEAELARRWCRELDVEADEDTQFVPSHSRDPRAVLVTSWSPTP